jgi:hypothetical protein
MEGWRQWRPGEEKIFQQKRRLDLTPTGLLMEGDYTNNEVNKFYKKGSQEKNSASTRVIRLDQIRACATASHLGQAVGEANIDLPR